MTPEVPLPTEASRRLCARCECRLSRYNSEDHCALCARVHGDLAVTVPERVWKEEEIRAAVKERDFGLICRLVRQHGALRQEDVSALTGLSQAFLSMLESGSRRLTHIDKIAQLVAGLEMPLDLACIMLMPFPDSAPTQQPEC